ncbi:HsdM family class I SAM-dependent methyltransferase [Methanoregula formicica]|uniref:site-specific DNA-methyltransferase (adenine-specific) n=1 Tax=Methanoregula formicica (strain DSM 22288 / NBRC 105244 / SMSP) TaxID=593750 RepID=L0HGU3_METFS|nr:Eco57I restriction-modification methylase domain-containing protein [Methanoregula formicica]AGB02289.1 type I restriction-modification system methyltransferase subunit [Methanoregula formicica SMSP]
MQNNPLKIEFNRLKVLLTAEAEKIKNPENRNKFARSICQLVLKEFWSDTCTKNGCNWKICESFVQFDKPESTGESEACDVGSILAQLPFSESSYLIGTLYTALLPQETQADFGAYYTPPALVDRLVGMVTDQGFDWKNGTVMDLSCGGGAFLSPVALRMLESYSVKDRGNPSRILELISKRLQGFEIDPFAAWMSQVLVEIVLLEICINASTRLPIIVNVCDTLETLPNNGEEVDLVIGNPPYRKITLPPHQRRIFSRSLYGHANLYGVFTDIAIRWTKPAGLIAYVTPTSFLGGQYFKSLRALLSQYAPPVLMDFISDRKGVFEDVLQETMLVVYKRTENEKEISRDQWVTVHDLKSNGPEKPVVSERIGTFLLPNGGEEPWIIPKAPDQVKLIDNLKRMRNRIVHFGFEVNTGPLVWNRHKNQMSTEKQEGNYPLIWAESIHPDGRFLFSAKKRNHRPYLTLKRNQEFLVTKKPCILIQRTTAKEQKKRIVATTLPKEFLHMHGGVVIENHVNIIKQTKSPSLASLETLAVLLNSKMIDKIFRLINGSVAVSAFELKALPLPNKSDIRHLEQLIQSGVSNSEIELAIKMMYER